MAPMLVRTTYLQHGPAALANYQARGLRPYRSEEAEEELPESPPGSWPATC